MKIAIVTLGCKVNEYESLSMASQLKKFGYEVINGLEVADIYVLNTCAVTNIAERKSRQMIAKIKKLNSRAKIIVTGCASQNNPKQFEQYDNVFSIIGNQGKQNVIEFINNSFKQELPQISFEFNEFEYASQEKTRHYIKIQDGCNNFCSYCIIPYTRGRSRSRDMSSIIDEIKKSTAKEIVLTGINVSDYRQNGERALIDLMTEIDKLNVRFRLSSLECVIIDDEFLDKLSGLKNFCPFFHLSLQSACNDTLKRMNRHYTIEEYIDVCNKIKAKFPDACISTDLIVGFKGETDEEFNKTLENLKKIPFAFIHIFPYSVRKGTNAEKLKGDVPTDVVKAREKQLLEYNEQIYTNFVNENIGETRKVLIEETIDGYSVGYTENYLYCYIKGDFPAGEILTVKITEPYKFGALAEII